MLTSGRGERVYFSEAFIIFTSNLGIYRINQEGRREPNVSYSDSYEVLIEKVRDEIDQYFKLQLGRPRNTEPSRRKLPDLSTSFAPT